MPDRVAIVDLLGLVGSHSVFEKGSIVSFRLAVGIVEPKLHRHRGREENV